MKLLTAQAQPYRLALLAYQVHTHVMPLASADGITLQEVSDYLLDGKDCMAGLKDPSEKASKNNLAFWSVEDESGHSTDDMLEDGQVWCEVQDSKVSGYIKMRNAIEKAREA